MQRLPNSVSLNALRAFECVARHESVKVAAVELSVTAGAVSHRLKQLEQALGVMLFHRRNNAIELTDDGRSFSRELSPAIASMVAAARRVTRDANEVSLRVTASLAMRWLIPRLDDFRARHPRIRVSLETVSEPSPMPEQDVDLAIGYSRGEPIRRGALKLVVARCGIYASPGLIERESANGLADIVRLPLLGATEDDWNWQVWCKANGVDMADLSFRHRFDVDDAAIAAAQAGLGVVLATSMFVERELAAGNLVAVPGCPGLDVGAYWLLPSPTGRRSVALMIDWLRETVAARN